MVKTAKNKKKSAAAKKKEMEELALAEQQAEEDEFEFQKTCLEIRVKELETLNLGLQRKSEYLESQNDVYKAQLGDLREEKEDLVAHLERCYSEAKTNVKELEDRLYGTHQARLDERKEAEKALAQKDKELQQVKLALGKDILGLDAKLTALEDFRIQKETLAAEKKQLEKTLKDETERFNRNYEELEHNLIRYREKIKNESVDMIKKMATDIQQAGKLCLTATVKSAISKNVRLQNELEVTSKNNLKLREKFKKLEESFREKRMTIEVIEEENAFLRDKSTQYRKMTQELIDRQMLMEKQTEHFHEIQKELVKVKALHSVCKTEEEIEGLVGSQLEKVVSSSNLNEDEAFKERFEADRKRSDAYKNSEIKRFKDMIISLAITAKQLSQAQTQEEIDFSKERFKLKVVKLYHTACEFDDLSPEIKSVLKYPELNVTLYFGKV